MIKYDWVKLKREFTTHSKYATMSLREFASVKNIPYGANFRKHTAGWLDARAAKQSHKSRKIEEKLIEQEIASAEEFNRRHLRLYTKALAAAEKILDEQLGKSVDMFGKVHDTGIFSGSKLKSVAQILEIAQKGQRMCLGMDKDYDPQTQSEESAIDSLLQHLKERKPKGGDGDRV